MPSWILPGRRNSPKMRYKALLEKSFAFSRTCNPRNLEYQWYPLWDQTLSDLVSEVPNLIVAPQYPVWFVPQDNDEVDDDDDDEDDDGHSSDPEEILINIGESHTERTLLEDDDEGEEVADVSFASTMPEKGARGVIVDFAVINLSAVPLNHPKQKIRYGGWRITAANIGLLVEVKRFASRSLTGAELEEALEGRISEAHEDLIDQAAYLFLQDEGKESVLAIAAAGNSSTRVYNTYHDRHPLIGPWWCSTKIKRDDVKRVMALLAEKDPTYQGHANSRLGAGPVQLKWSSLLRLDVARSNNRLHTVYNSLKEIGVLETPVDV